MKLLLELVQYAAVLLVELLVRCLPPRAADNLAQGVGWLWFTLDRRRRERALESIGVARRGGLEVEDDRELALAACRSLFRVPLEMLLFRRYIRSSRQMIARCSFHGDWGRLQEDLASGTGGLFVSGHLGNWEAAAWGLKFLNVPCRVVVRPIENRFLDARATGSRGGSEGEGGIIAKRGAVRTMLRTLKKGGWVAVMADQNAGRRGTFVPFFGLEASTYAAPAVLAVRADVPMYVAATLRRADRPLSFDMHIQRLDRPAVGVEGEIEVVRSLLAAFLRRLEVYVRLAPEQYNWIHRRWKSRPPEEQEGVVLPAYAEPWEDLEEATRTQV